MAENINNPSVPDPPIPARVVLGDNITLTPSEFGGFCCDRALAPGDLIFTIPNPLICLPKFFPNLNTPGLRQKTCYNCFATCLTNSNTSGTALFRSNPLKSPSYVTCGICEKVVGACNKGCQDAEDLRHLQRGECGFLRALRHNRPLKNRRNYFSKDWFHSLVQLIIMWNNEELSASEQQEIFSLQFRPDTTPQDFGPYNMLMMEEAIASVVATSPKPLQASKVRDWLSNIRLYLFHVEVPIPKPLKTNSLWDSKYNPELGYSKCIGFCFEPFINRFSLWCIPNTIIRFEGRELQVRAAGIIPAGDPLYIHTTRDPASHSEPSEACHYSISNWGIDCKCEGLACKGTRGTPPSLAPWHEELLKFLAQDNYGTASDISNAKNFLNHVEQSGFNDYYGYPSYELRRRMVVAYLAAPNDTNYIDALKALLSMVFVIGPTQINYISKYELLDALSTLCSVLIMLQKDHDLSQEAAKLPAADDMRMSHDVPLFLRHLHWQGSSKWHGRKSEMTRVSRQNLDRSTDLFQSLRDSTDPPINVDRDMWEAEFRSACSRELRKLLIWVGHSDLRAGLITLEELGL